MPGRGRLVYLVTHPMTSRLLLRGQLEWMRQRGFEVTLVTSTADEPATTEPDPAYSVRRIPMAREISPAADLISLFRIARELRRLRPHIVNASTPKAGVLGITAARLARVPARIYTLRGLRLETTSGLRHRALTVTERLACAGAHRVVCVSESLRRRCVELRLCRPEAATVLADGSSNGVDLARFAETPPTVTDRLRRELDLGRAPVVGFVGRLTRDKGVEDLRAAFARIETALPEARLLLIGGHEAGDRVSAATRRWISDDRRVLGLGRVDDPAPYYPLMDVLAFPSYREGMPNAPLEAAAARVPTVGYRVTGTVDAIEDGVTGALIEPGKVDDLARALVRYLEDGDLARRHGCAAHQRVADRYRPERVWRALETEYARLLGEPEGGETRG